MDKDRILKEQAKVMKEMWSELQTLKRILIDDYPTTWKEIQNKL
tara:strand:- start:1428 stop:1559 length:132 start_codon:yes stop_codon:yes gene_type:complete